MSDRLNSNDYEINRLIDKLDQVAVSYEAKWGIYFLESRCGEEMQEKWQRQVDKLNEAISSGDLASVAALVPGCIRGYEAMEKKVIESGYEPSEIEFWTVERNSKVYHIVKSVQDARRLDAQGKENVITAQAAVEILGSQEAKFLEGHKVNKKEGEKFDFEKGDELPF